MNIEAKERVLQINMGQVPKGYKKTKVGIIPKEWNLKILGSLGEFKKGKGISIKDTIETGLPAMMYGDIYVKYNTQFNKVDFRINQNIAQNSRKVNKGDLLFTGSGETAIEIGKCVTYQGEETIYIGGDIIGLTPEKDDSLFLAYQQNGYEQIKQKARFGQGHSVVHIYTHHIKSLIIALPPLSEQQKIAEILSSCDKVIELKEKLIEQKKLQKKYLMQVLLDPKSPSFRRLPGFDKDWGEIKLGECFTERRENNCTLRLLSITSEKGVIDRMEIKHKDNSNEDKSKYKVILKGDIGYNTMRMWQGVSGVSSLTGIISPAYTVCKPKEEICPEFFGYLFKLQNVINVFHRYSQGLVNDTLSLKYAPFAKLKFSIPKYEEQKAIANVLSVIDKKINLLEKELKQQKLKKKALMQLLLTGKARVNVS
jgi:type I restriction enzyme S subunit